jgi:hypothetical protein
VHTHHDSDTRDKVTRILTATSSKLRTQSCPRTCTRTHTCTPCCTAGSSAPRAPSPAACRPSSTRTAATPSRPPARESFLAVTPATDTSAASSSCTRASTRSARGRRTCSAARPSSSRARCGTRTAGSGSARGTTTRPDTAPASRGRPTTMWKAGWRPWDTHRHTELRPTRCLCVCIGTSRHVQSPRQCRGAVGCAHDIVGLRALVDTHTEELDLLHGQRQAAQPVSSRHVTSHHIALQSAASPSQHNSIA